MQYDLAATIHFGPCSRFNEFLLSCMCVSLGLALSFDPHHHQCISKRHRLALQNEDVEPLQERYLALYYVFDFFLSKKSEEICPVNGTYWVCLFVCFFFTLNDNSNRIVTGRFPTILPGKLECSWIFEFLSFIKFGHLSWQFGIVACKKRACVHICSFQQFRPILLIYWRLDSVWWDPLDWTFLIIWITWIMFFFFCVVFKFWINKSGVQQFVLCSRMQLSWSKREISWDCADKMVCEYVERLSVSLQLREILESSSALFSVFFVSPRSLSNCQSQATTICSPEGVQISRESGVI